jgi:nitrite reductase/ring-hydroxylating ferredoxin subunit
MADRDLANGIASTDLEEGRILAGVVDGRDVVLVRHRGRVCALAGTCTHLKAPLADGIVADGTLRCPWHHARFNVETGEAVGAPAFAPLDRFTVVEEQGRVRVEGPAPRARPHRRRPGEGSAGSSSSVAAPRGMPVPRCWRDTARVRR